MKYVFLVALMSIVGGLSAQFVVLDKSGDEPVIGATVQIQCGGYEKFVATDVNGNFEIPCTSCKWIVVSAIGYLTQKIKAPIDVNINLVRAIYDVDPVVITGQITQRTLNNSVQKIRVLSAEEIESSAGVSAKDVLELEANLNFTQDPSLGSAGGINGMNSEHLQILIDGVPMIGRLNGAIDLEQIPTSSIERIEIITGPMSVEYGSEAIAGTINIITKKTGSEDGLSLRMRGYVESTSKSSFDLSSSFNIGKWGTRIGLNRTNFNGLEYEDARGHSWKPKEQNFLDLSVSRQWKKVGISFSSQAVNEVLYIKGQEQSVLEQRPINDSIVELYSLPFALDQEFRTRRLNNTLNIDYASSTGWSFNSTTSVNQYQRERLTFRNDLRSDYRELTAGTEGSDTSRFNMFFHRTTIGKTWGKWILRAGTDAKQEVGTGKRIENNQQKMAEIAAFISAEYTIGKFTFRPGLRLIHNTSFRAPLIPSIGMRFQTNNWVFRASHASGFKAPELKDLYFFFVDSNHNIRGNENLKAEYSNSFQVSANRNWFWKKGVLKTGANGFFNKVEDQISLVASSTDATLFQYENIDQSTFFGSGIDFEWIGEQIRIYGASNLVFQSSSVTTTNKFLGSNQSSISASYSMKSLKTNFEFRCNLFGKRQTFLVNENAEVVDAVSEAYQMLNVMASKRLLNQRLKIDAGVRNILNVISIDQLASNNVVHTNGASQQLISPGRSLFIRINYTIQ